VQPDWPVFILAAGIIGVIIAAYVEADRKRTLQQRAQRQQRRAKRSGWRCCNSTNYGSYCTRCRRPAPTWTTRQALRPDAGAVRGHGEFRQEFAAKLEQARKDLTPEPYDYYSIRAVHPDSIELMTDEGEIRSGVVIENGPEAMANMEVGGRITWDGQQWRNYVPPSKQRALIKQVNRFNALPHRERSKITHSDLQALRESGFIFEWDYGTLISAEEAARRKAIKRQAEKPFRFNL
jgi:hypothetical protein